MVSPSIDWPIVDRSLEVNIANRVKPAPIIEVIDKHVIRCQLKLISFNRFMDSKNETEQLTNNVYNSNSIKLIGILLLIDHEHANRK